MLLTSLELGISAFSRLVPYGRPFFGLFFRAGDTFPFACVDLAAV